MSGIEEALHCISAKVGSTFAAKQYYFAVVAADGNVDAASAAGAYCDGIVQEDEATVGSPITLAIGGRSKIVYGGSVTQGDLLATDANGKAVTATTGDVVLGRALVTGVDGDTGSMIFHPSYIFA